MINCRFAPQFWKYFYNYLTRYLAPEELTVMNYGYATLSEDGKYLKKYMKDDNIYQYQLYDYPI